LAVAEKDYLLALVLKILYGSHLADKLVFKGGTALHHLYLDQLRFSEDLDFGSLAEVTLDDLQEIFSEYEFLEIKKASLSDYTLKIARLRFQGPLGQPNSLRIDIDLTQEVILPARFVRYRNFYHVDVEVLGMDMVEICAEKMRAMNERARYRDFYDLAMAFKKSKVDPHRMMEILERKELRRELRKENLLENYSIAQRAKEDGRENLHYREEITKAEVEAALKKILALLP
jgi:predicted nucleotidyltransferase component of viral defense system